MAAPTGGFAMPLGKIGELYAQMQAKDDSIRSLEDQITFHSERIHEQEKIFADEIGASEKRLAAIGGLEQKALEHAKLSAEPLAVKARVLTHVVEELARKAAGADEGADAFAAEAAAVVEKLSMATDAHRRSASEALAFAEAFRASARRLRDKCSGVDQARALLAKKREAADSAQRRRASAELELAAAGAESAGIASKLAAARGILGATDAHSAKVEASLRQAEDALDRQALRLEELQSSTAGRIRAAEEERSSLARRVAALLCEGNALERALAAARAATRSSRGAARRSRARAATVAARRSAVAAAAEELGRRRQDVEVQRTRCVAMLEGVQSQVLELEKATTTAAAPSIDASGMRAELEAMAMAVEDHRGRAAASEEAIRRLSADGGGGGGGGGGGVPSLEERLASKVEERDAAAARAAAVSAARAEVRRGVAEAEARNEAARAENEALRSELLELQRRRDAAQRDQQRAFQQEEQLASQERAMRLQVERRIEEVDARLGDQERRARAWREAAEARREQQQRTLRSAHGLVRAVSKSLAAHHQQRTQRSRRAGPAEGALRAGDVAAKASEMRRLLRDAEAARDEALRRAREEMEGMA